MGNKSMPKNEAPEIIKIEIVIKRARELGDALSKKIV